MSVIQCGFPSCWFASPRDWSLNLEILELLAPRYSSNNQVWIPTGQLHPAQHCTDTASVSNLGAGLYSTSWLHGTDVLISNFKPSALQWQEAAKDPRLSFEQSEKLVSTSHWCESAGYGWDATLKELLSTPIPMCCRVGVGIYPQARHRDKDGIWKDALSLQSNSCRATHVVHAFEEAMEKKKLSMHSSTTLIPGQNCV